MSGTESIWKGKTTCHPQFTEEKGQLISFKTKEKSKNSTYVRVNKLPNNTGQGHNLNLMLFDVIMNEIIKKIKTTGSGYRMDRQKFKTTCNSDEA